MSRRDHIDSSRAFERILQWSLAIFDYPIQRYLIHLLHLLNFHKFLCFSIKEREETVKSDIFNVYITILQQTRPLVVKPKQLSLVNGNGDFEEGAVSLLKGQINSIVKAIQKLLRNKNAKTRQGCFSLLTQLVNVLPGGLANYLAQIIPGINYSLKYVWKTKPIDKVIFLLNLVLL